MINTKTILIPHLNPSVKKAIENGNMTPKKHPGRVIVGTSFLPNDLINAIKKILNDTPLKNIVADADKFKEVLYFRQMPANMFDLQSVRDSSIAEILRTKQLNENEQNMNEIKMLKKSAERIVQNTVRERMLAWFPIEYNSYVGKQYLLSRMPGEYAILNKIFAEIVHRCPNFEPHSLFDFGSGVGTVTWAAQKYWSNSIQEYFCVDLSSDMNELAKLLLKRGDEKALLPHTNIFFRQYLPARTTLKYSLVVASFSLLELPSTEARLATISKLWNKTEHFLVLIEFGHKHGFKVINEARDYILKTDAKSQYSEKCHIFAPCPHDLNCPRSKMHDKPCRFHVSFASTGIGRNMKYMSERFSYVVLSKGERPTEDPQWPRVISPTLKRKKHAHCRLCSKEGKLHQMVFTKTRYGTIMHQFGRSVKWGDRLPVDITESEIEKWDNSIQIQDITEEELDSSDENETFEN